MCWSEPGDLVLDPFSGRGTTALEALLNGRRAIGSDTNPVAACISQAKTMAPTYETVQARLEQLKAIFHESRLAESSVIATEFFSMCFHLDTLNEILFLRDELRWRESTVDCFIAALMLGCLHGESHRTEMCLSNRMPRTISTKPDYSVRWWKANSCVAPKRKTFDILMAQASYRFASPVPTLFGKVVEADARTLSEHFAEAKGCVKLVITSPPYIDITNYQEDQWLRLWFLGGSPRPVTKQIGSDDRHRRVDNYWQFLADVWLGVKPLLSSSCQIIVRIGGTRLSREELGIGLLGTMRSALGTSVVLEELYTSEIVRGQRRSFTSRGNQVIQSEHDFRFAV